MKTEDEILEYCASLEHKRWAKWQAWLHKCCTANGYGSLVIPREKVARWERQINTEYKDLSEEEKESDREQVRPYLKYIFSKID